MKRAHLICLIQLLTCTFLLSQLKPLAANESASTVAPSIVAPGNASQPRILSSYGKLPLSFEANQGQTDATVKFLSRTRDYSLFLTADETVLTLRAKSKKNSTQRLPAGIQGFVSGHRYSDAAISVKPDAPLGAALRTEQAGVLRMKLRNANSTAKVTGVDEMAGTTNYFIGNNPAKWKTNVPSYAKVRYEEIYSGIDLVYYGNQRQLEYDFIVSPGADPHRIAFDVAGAKKIRRDAQGDLVLTMSAGDIRWHKPVVYQENNGARQQIAARYTITNANRVAFEVAQYDASRALYIDPLIYSTYLGGSGGDDGFAITVDGAGNAYVTGDTNSTDFPTLNPLQPYGGSYDIFVTKLNPAGTALVYSTYLGGSDLDGGVGIAVDSAGNAYIAGETLSADFPVTPGAFQMTLNGSTNAFITKFNSTGSALIYSTYLGGARGAYANGIALDSSGSAYVLGNANEVPVTSGAFQTNCASVTGYGCPFVSKLDSSGSALVYSTYLSNNNGGGTSTGIAVDASGSAYVIGYTQSPDFPVTPGAFQTVCNGLGHFYPCVDAFVSKFNPTGSALVYSTFLGGSGGSPGGNYGYAIAVDSSGNAYVTGQTGSKNFPTTPGAFDTVYHSHGDAFVTKFNAAGSALLYSTYLGGGSTDQGQSIAVDTSGNAYITGATASVKFPTTTGSVQPACGGSSKTCSNAFVTEINPAGSALVYSTFLGGSRSDSGYAIALGSANDAYVAGRAVSANFPVTPGAFQTTNAGKEDAFVSAIRMAVMVATTTTLSSAPNPSIFGQPVTFTAVVNSASGAPPDGETISFMRGKTLLGTGTLSGGAASFTTSTLKVGTASFTAVYGGDLDFFGSKSEVVRQRVEKAAH
jgi:hypothetical protein